MSLVRVEVVFRALAFKMLMTRSPRKVGLFQSGPSATLQIATATQQNPVVTGLQSPPALSTPRLAPGRSVPPSPAPPAHEGRDMMLPMQPSSLLLLALLSVVRAVFKDEVDHIDYHHDLLGLPQPETTFFHRPRKDDKASLLYTLSDVGVLGAVNPSSGAVLWRQILNSSLTDGGGFMRAGEGEDWLVSALGNSVHAWDAVSGRNRFWVDLMGQVRDLEMMELTESGRKDVLVLLEEHGSSVVRRLNSDQGSVIWEFRAASKDIPLQVSTSVDKIFVISLRGNAAAYNLKITTLDTLTGALMDEFVIGTKGEIHNAEDVMFVGANSAAPLVAWTDAGKTQLRVNVLGSKTRQEFPLGKDTISVELHAPHLIESQPHFLVLGRTHTGSRADVYHVGQKSKAISKAYSLPDLVGHCAVSTSSLGADVYFTRLTEDEANIYSSASYRLLARWPLLSETGKYKASAVHTVSEVIKKSGAADKYAVRSAVVTDADDWVMVQNGRVAWTRLEGMTGGVAATFSDIPESEEFARTLEQEAHGNPLEAYMHRLRRHFNELQHLPGYVRTIPSRLVSAILGTEVTVKDGQLGRDSFGFNKLVVLATRRGRLYGIDVGKHGKVLWSRRAFKPPKGQKWLVKGFQVEDAEGRITARGTRGESITFTPDTGKVIKVTAPSSRPPVEATALVDSPSGQWLLPIGEGGRIENLPTEWAPKQTVVVQGSAGELSGKIFISEGATSSELTTWSFSLPNGQSMVKIATRPAHDVVASIGRVLGDRSVRYKYLNHNTLVLAAADKTASTLTVYLLDTVSGQVLSSCTYQGVDTSKPVECVYAENWFVCSFFGQYTSKDKSSQTLKGWQLVVSDLYESDSADDRGPLGKAANFSSLGPIDTPTNVALPAVVSQSFILAAPLSALQVSQTRQGISSRQVLGYLPEAYGIVGLPRMLLEPRRPVGRDPTAAEVEEGLIRYHAVIEIDPKLVLTHERHVLGVQGIIVAPALVESTGLLFAFGVDVFGTRVAPSSMFDILGKGFNKLSLVLTVAALAAAVVALAPVVRYTLALCHGRLLIGSPAGGEETNKP